MMNHPIDIFILKLLNNQYLRLNLYLIEVYYFHQIMCIKDVDIISLILIYVFVFLGNYNLTLYCPSKGLKLSTFEEITALRYKIVL